jgi:uncharacterized protein with HEPN domain
LTVDDRQRHYLTQIAQEIAAARRLSAAHTAESFFRDEIAIAALERFIERISEASRRVDAGLKLLEPAVPWSNIAGIGNILRHDYDSIDLTILWNIATRELPQLEAAIERLLQSADRSA